MKIKKSLAIPVIVIIVLLIGFVVWEVFVNEISGGGEPGNYTITLTDQGYSPETLTIKVGSTVTFKTTRDKVHWPASNIHPTHDIFPQFDAKKPLSPDESWSFKFDKVGRWAFHDHIRSYYKGVITVVE